MNVKMQEHCRYALLFVVLLHIIRAAIVPVFVERSSGLNVYDFELVKFESFCEDNLEMLLQLDLEAACVDFIRSVMFESYNELGRDHYIILLADNPFNLDVRLARCNLLDAVTGEMVSISIFLYTNMRRCLKYSINKALIHNICC